MSQIGCDKLENAFLYVLIGDRSPNIAIASFNTDLFVLQLSLFITSDRTFISNFFNYYLKLGNTNN